MIPADAQRGMIWIPPFSFSNGVMILYGAVKDRSSRIVFPSFKAAQALIRDIFPNLLSIGVFLYIPSKSTFFLIHSTTLSTFSSPRIFVNWNGLSPRIFLESLSITSRLAPTYGARSILLMVRLYAESCLLLLHR